MVLYTFSGNRTEVLVFYILVISNVFLSSFLCDFPYICALTKLLEMLFVPEIRCLRRWRKLRFLFVLVYIYQSVLRFKVVYGFINIAISDSSVRQTLENVSSPLSIVTVITKEPLQIVTAAVSQIVPLPFALYTHTDEQQRKTLLRVKNTFSREKQKMGLHKIRNRSIVGTKNVVAFDSSV